MVIIIMMMVMIIIMITMIIIIMITIMIMLMMVVVIRQLYTRPCILAELEITAGHRLMTRRNRSIIGSNFLQLIYEVLHLTTCLHYVSLFYENTHILSQNLRFLSIFKSFKKDIGEQLPSG